MLAGGDYVGPFYGDEQQIGLDDVGFGEQYVGRRGVYHASVSFFHKRVKPRPQFHGNVLMGYVRGRHRDQFSIQEFVAFVVGGFQVVFVCEFYPGLDADHG